MKKAQRKDFFREIKKSLNRYLSILCMVALGVAFYAGVRSSEPDMKLSADSYLDESNLFDIRLFGAWGITEEDVKALRQIEGVTQAEGACQAEAFCLLPSKSWIVTVYSECGDMNRVTIEEGRAPKQSGECFVDTLLAEAGGYHIGDTIRLTSGTKEPLTDTLAREEYTIVGIGTSPFYLSWDRGTASIGNGKVNAFVTISREDFVQEYYTAAYLTVDEADGEICYSDRYKAIIEERKTAAEELGEKRCFERFESVKADAEAEIAKGRKELADAREELEKARSEYETGLAEYEEGLRTLAALQAAQSPMAAQAEAALKETQAVLAAAEAELEEGENAFLEEEEKAERELSEAEEELAALKAPEWYVLDRNSLQTYVEYKMDAERIGAIGKVFPAIFFLVAALVSLTTMTRMVEEERTQIGTLKALGYVKHAIAAKYLYYALSASLVGSISGALAGGIILPQILIRAYGILYTNVQTILTPIQWDLSFLAMGIAVACTVFATWLACYKELLAAPAVLMRPTAPKQGKRVWLEYLPFIWKRLNFSKKSTIRNLFRYKKRFFMTVLGIGGCTALLMVGFGLRDSIQAIVDNQYLNLWTYDAYLSVKDTKDDAKRAELKEKIETTGEVKDSLYILQTLLDTESASAAKEAYLFVPERLEGLEEFLVLRDRKTKESRTLSGDGVILSEKLAKILGVKAGDTIFVKPDELTSYEVTVTATVENYLYHYVYMTKELYESLYEKPPEYNQYFLKLEKLSGEKEEAFAARMLEQDEIESVSFVADLQARVQDMMKSLDLVVWVLIIAAGLLAFVVLYNLNNINIIERKRELATLKVLGFYDGEVAGYVYRENVWLTLFGVAAGLVMGIFLHRYVILTCEIDAIMFGRSIRAASYGFSILLTCLFATLVNAGMFYKLRAIDMVESLKNIE